MMSMVRPLALVTVLIWTAASLTGQGRGQPPPPLPAVHNTIKRATVDLRHTLRQDLALGIGYAYDAYDVDDFALSPGTLNTPVFPTMLHLGYVWRPFNAHTGSVRLMYRW